MDLGGFGGTPARESVQVSAPVQREERIVNAPTIEPVRLASSPYRVLVPTGRKMLLSFGVLAVADSASAVVRVKMPVPFERGHARSVFCQSTDHRFARTANASGSGKSRTQNRHGRVTATMANDGSPPVGAYTDSRTVQKPRLTGVWKRMTGRAADSG